MNTTQMRWILAFDIKQSVLTKCINKPEFIFESPQAAAEGKAVAIKWLAENGWFIEEESELHIIPLCEFTSHGALK